MRDWFELKSYKQLEVALAAANIVLTVAIFVLGFSFVFSLPDRDWIVGVVTFLSDNKLIALLPVGGVAVVWGWFATQILRLHDRIHEPHLRKWRAGYDADFVLRALLTTESIPPEFFERAYSDRRLRSKCMQRLFYRFAGDAAQDSEGRRLFFYSEMARYWSMALVEIYTYLGILGLAGYAWLRNVQLSPIIVLVLAAINVAARVYSNHVLDSAHEITIDQIAIVRAKKARELETEVASLLRDLGIRAR